MAGPTDVELANAAHREYLRAALHRAAQAFGASIRGEAVFGRRDRTIGAPVTAPDGPRWLRVSWSERQWTNGEFWTGNADAGAIFGVRKPKVLATTDWTTDNDELRAELMTEVTESKCSPTPELRAPLDLNPAWWASLREQLGRVAEAPTTRVAVSLDELWRSPLVYLGVDIDHEFTHWQTAHADLQWTNLTAPDCWLLDWESWGQAPVGFDAATLYCYSVLVPEIAAAVRATFADVLDTPTGRLAQLVAITRILHRVQGGDYPDLAIPLHRHARQLIVAAGWG